MKQKTVSPGLSPSSPNAPRLNLSLGQQKKYNIMSHPKPKIKKIITLFVFVLSTVSCGSSKSHKENQEYVESINRRCIVYDSDKVITLAIKQESGINFIFPPEAFWPKDSLNIKKYFSNKIKWIPDTQSVNRSSNIVDSILLNIGAIGHRCIDVDDVIRFDKDSLIKFKRQYYGYIEYGDTIINVIGLNEKSNCNNWENTLYKRRVATGYSGNAWLCRVNISNHKDSDCYLD